MARTAVTEGDVAHGTLEVQPAAFIGRDYELATLATALSSPPALVLIEGEAGIGKTRLIHEFLATPAAPAQHALVAPCPAFRQPCTLGPLADALRLAARDITGLALTDLAGALRPLLPEWAATLPPPPEPLEDATAARYRIYRALAELLTALNVSVLVLEDAHWADEGTLEFLLFLASRQHAEVTRRQITPSLVVTYRPEDVPGDSLLLRLSSQGPAAATRTRISLPLLDVPQTASLVRSMVGGGQISEEFAGFLRAHTDGLPLAVEESVRLMAERADMVRRDGQWVRRRDLDQIAVPPTIRDAVLERTGRLSAAARAVLQAAAVLAEPASESLLLAVSGLPVTQAADGLAAAIGCGLLAEDAIPYGRGLVSFRHALAARGVYEALPGALRRELHLRAGRVLEGQSPPPAPALARHFREAGQTREWRRYAEQAADLALASGDEVTAATLLHDLVAHASLPPEAIVPLTRKIPMLALTEHAQLSDLIEKLRQVLARDTLSSEQRAEAGYQLGQILLDAGEYQTGAAELERAIPGLAHRPVEAISAMIRLGWPDQSPWPAAVHRNWLDLAAAAMADAVIPAHRRLALACNRLTALLDLGDASGWTAAAEFPAGAATAREGLYVVVGSTNIADAAMSWGRYRQARQRLQVALELAHRYDYPDTYVAGALVTLAHLDWFTGPWTGLADRATSLAEQDDPRMHMEAILVSGLLEAAAGASRAAEHKLRLVLDECARRGVVDLPSEPAAALARLRLREGHAAEAVALTEEAMGTVIAKGAWLRATDIAPVRVEALAAAGRAQEAEDLVTAFSHGLHDRDAPAANAALTTCRAHLAAAHGEHLHAAELFASAATDWQVLPRPYNALLAREQQGCRLLAAGRAEPALAELGAVFRDLSELGAISDAERVVRLLRDQGVHVPRLWRHGRSGYGTRLSPRETEVVRLIVAGRSTREIAEQLCRSPKTVDTQLSSAMRKLGAPSRPALAALAIEAGIVARDSPQTGDGARSPRRSR